MEDSSSCKWPTTASSYKLLGIIGNGAYAVVYKALCLTNNRTVAIKVLKLEDPCINLDDVREEVLAMRLCSSDNVLFCYCCFNVNSSLWIVTPFMNKGSFLRILQYMKKTEMIKEGQGFDEPIVAYIIQQTLYGLQYLHDSNLLHRDVKAGNILVDSSGSVRLADFGVARVIEGTQKHSEAKTFAGTPCWMAPEIMNQCTYDSKADMWSLGITALELYKGYPPLARFEAMEIIIRTVQGDAPSFDSYSDVYPSKPSSAFSSWINCVLQKDPEERSSACKALCHRWFNQCDEGKEMLLELLKKIPDLEADYNCDLDVSFDKPAYVNNTNWDFSLEYEWMWRLTCRGDDQKKEKPEWLKRFEDVSVSEDFIE